MEKNEEINVLGEALQACSERPLTGFYRDGKCNTCNQDVASHTVCILATKEFLEYSRFRGNDLSTPVPDYAFEGVKPGDSWCLCAARWLEAYESGMAPGVYLMKTHKRALELIAFEKLREYAIDLN